MYSVLLNFYRPIFFKPINEQCGNSTLCSCLLLMGVLPSPKFLACIANFTPRKKSGVLTFLSSETNS